MSEYVNVAVDAMGGDNAPGEIIKGTVDALNAYRQLRVMLVGLEEIVKEELAKYTYPEKRVRIVNATEIIEMAEPPVNAIRKKKDSSIVKGLQLVKEGKCDAFVSAGSTGAILAGGQLIVGRIRGIERSPLAPLIPTSKGPALLIDCGANMDARPSQLVQFAQMGSIYMKNITGNPNPRVAIVNVGAEEEKGNALVKETFPLLKACDNINFIGSIEARDITDGYADVIVCDAFVGNVILKMFEGVASTLLHGIKDAIMSSFKSKIGGLLIKDSLKSLLGTYDVASYGGAPMLGLRGLVVKTHGNAEAIEIQNALGQCISFTEQKLTEQFQTGVSLKTRKTAAADNAETRTE